jgi:hypothetical protein
MDRIDALVLANVCQRLYPYELARLSQTSKRMYQAVMQEGELAWRKWADMLPARWGREAEGAAAVGVAATGQQQQQAWRDVCPAARACRRRVEGGRQELRTLRVRARECARSQRGARDEQEWRRLQVKANTLEWRIRGAQQDLRACLGLQGRRK